MTFPADGAVTRDPLRAAADAFDVLGIGPTASDAEIARGFRNGLGRAGDVSRLMAAKKALESPVERGVLRVLHYDATALVRLEPNAIGDPDVLAPDRRAATAASWEKQLKAVFPDPAIMHSLALLWYWSALSESGTGRLSDPSSIVSWEASIGYWSALVATDGYWPAATGLQGSDATSVASHLVARLHDDLADLSQRCRDQGTETVAARFHDLDVVLTAEIQTARAMAKAGIYAAGGKVCAGALLLGRIGKLEHMRDKVAAAAADAPSRSDLRSLVALLSPYSHVVVLLDADRADEALTAIDAFPAKVRRSDEVMQLRARALIVRGRQRASVGATKDAIRSCAEAVRCATSDRIGEEARTAVVSICRDRASAMPSGQRDDAIALLEQGLAVVDEPSLRLALADQLTGRGIGRITRAQEKLEGPRKPSKATLTALDRGLADLERAAEFGSEHAAEQAEMARGIIVQARFSREVGDRMAEANAAAGHGDWDSAVVNLRDALSATDDAPPELVGEIRRSLAVCLANRAGDQTAKAMTLINESPGVRSEPDIGAAFASLQASVASNKGSRWVTMSWIVIAIVGVLAALGGYYDEPAGTALWGDFPSNLVVRRLIHAIGVGVAGSWFTFLALWWLVIPAFEWLSEFFSKASALTVSPYGHQPTCALCSSSGSYEVQIGYGDRKTLCSSHVRDLESEMSAMQKLTIPPSAMMGLLTARNDLREAVELAPALENVREELRQLDEFLKKSDGL